MMLQNLKPVSTDPQPCKICGCPTPLFGSVDFHRSCEEARGKFLPSSGVPIHYRRCPQCGFLFTDCFDNWSEREFSAYIYNSDYVTVDPDYVHVRPLANAQFLVHMFEKAKGSLRVLDYGGATGTLAVALRQAGFKAAETYDPFVAEHATIPSGSFEVVTCFETLEHHPQPLAAIKAIAERTAARGIVVFSTVVQPADFDAQGMRWWYIGPRNGHISLFTRRALMRAWMREGFAFASFSDGMHLAFRQIPDFARHLIRAP
jgi:SAM-dependent methyltransferase